MSRVKGTILTNLVKSIRADKHTDYSPWLTDADREIASGTILSSSWYPYETYQHCFQALVSVYVKGDKAVVYDWGVRTADAFLKTVYSSQIIQGQPLQSLEKHLSMGQLFFDFGEIRPEPLSDRSVRVRVSGFPVDFEEFYHSLRGFYARILELGGAAKVESRFVTMVWKGDKDTTIEYSW